MLLVGLFPIYSLWIKKATDGGSPFSGASKNPFIT
jgi:hypothetical protein